MEQTQMQLFNGQQNRYTIATLTTCNANDVYLIGFSMPRSSISAAMRKSGLSRRQLFFGGSAAAVVSAMPAGHADALSCSRLVVGTWGGDFNTVLATAIGGPVKQATGADYVADLGGAGPRKARLMAERERPAGSFDVVCLDKLDMHQMASQGLLLPIDAAAVPNAGHILPGFRSIHSMPLAYSAKVIVYNPNRMAPPRSFNDLWAASCSGKVGFADLLALAVIESAAVIAGGDATNYEPGKDKLLALKATGAKIYPSNEAVAQALASEEIWCTIMWRARARQWKRAGLPVADVAPVEGATPITFEMGVAKNAPSKECAMSFLNHALEPKAQAALAKQIGYVPVTANVGDDADAHANGFTEEERQRFFKQDLDYLTKNQPQLLDWWTRVFKA